MQYEAVKFNILHPHQLGAIYQRSTEDASLFLTHLIYAGWAKNKKTSIVAFDVAQFFPFLNHNMLVKTLNKQGFVPEIGKFFAHYLTDCKTEYLWNNEHLEAFDATVGVGQGSALSPMLSVLYMAPILKLWEKKMDNKRGT